MTTFVVDESGSLRIAERRSEHVECGVCSSPLPVAWNLGATLGLLLAPASIFAQTVEIQHRVEAKLWLQRIQEWIEGITGLPAIVALVSLLAFVLALVAAIWLWNSRRKRSE